MKTKLVILYTLLFTLCSIMTWQAKSAWYAIVAYTLLIVIVKGLGRKVMHRHHG